ncbi:hypothetical protein AVEN_272879-1 [Araneus ventricosus]|uniref:Uncharacterized protein n=1 Tax=Araneus ventricosus TaxID=182803 RepID=A0A4Y2QVY4_ARAVE|nr:hypothetical protein AVEN_157244-1 [Araneus ventricosus]GBN67498.1 hypothetical protein AVEN_87783-1 [Araneus ventricosus]GBN81421.1 hypothetical protein AVEN_218430-1 [Araneus ventricosus]GBN81440.1 hypothetical protein AVEN_272879-1 [Araneus ventricosus]
MVAKLPLSTVVTAPTCLAPFLAVVFNSCHGSNLFGTFPGSCLPWLLNCCNPNLVNAVDSLTLEFESVVNTGKIDENVYNFVPIEICDSTQVSRLRSAE